MVSGGTGDAEQAPRPGPCFLRDTWGGWATTHGGESLALCLEAEPRGRRAVGPERRGRAESRWLDRLRAEVGVRVLGHRLGRTQGQTRCAL